MSLTYIRLETFRQLRNVQNLIFGIAVPIVMLFAFGAGFGGAGAVDPSTRLPWAMVTALQMAAYGAMITALSQSYSIVNERQLGWNRQLRVTPLSGFGYLVSKVVAALGSGLVAVAVILGLAFVAFHPDVPASSWPAAGFAIWCGAIPFALIAVIIGQLSKPDWAQPIFVVTFMVLSLLGGLWVPLQIFPDWVASVGRIVPSYWLNHLGIMGAKLSGDFLTPALVLLGWTVVLGGFIVWRYRRDAARS